MNSKIPSMGKKAFKSITTIAILSIIGFVSSHCSKIEPVRVIKVNTVTVMETSQTYCVVSSTIIDLGEFSEVSQHGFALSLDSNVEHAFKHTELNKRSDVGAFSERIDGLTPGTDYHIWAYASNDNGREHGEKQSFRTLEEPISDPPQLTTNPVEDPSWNSAICGGNITDEGGSGIIERGLCWGFESKPTIEDFSKSVDGGPGEFIVEMTDLTPATLYFVRAYARNSTDIAYGNEQAFTTPAEPVEPTVVTASPDDSQPNSIHCGGSIDNDGGAPIITKGFCWSTNPNPTLADASVVFEGGGSDPYEMVITGLDHDTEYFIRAYATNSGGKTGYGQQEVFRTQFLCGSILLDPRDLEEYPTISMGEQCWLAQNLRTGEIVPAGSEQGPNGTIEKYCYEDNEDNCAAFGGFYTWDEMMQYNRVEASQGVCPDRWHVPSDAEWITLERFLGMQ